LDLWALPTLPIALNIARAHGGTLTAEHRDAGRGAFRLTLPALPSASAH
jgi:signal transduction histidine kinase